MLVTWTLQGGQKAGPLRLKTHIFCLHLQNAWTSFDYFWITSMLFYSEHICWFHIYKIHHTKWRHLGCPGQNPRLCVRVCVCVCVCVSTEVLWYCYMRPAFHKENSIVKTLSPVCLRYKHTINTSKQYATSFIACGINPFSSARQETKLSVWV